MPNNFFYTESVFTNETTESSQVIQDEIADILSEEVKPPAEVVSVDRETIKSPVAHPVKETLTPDLIAERLQQGQPVKITIPSLSKLGIFDGIADEAQAVRDAILEFCPYLSTTVDDGKFIVANKLSDVYAHLAACLETGDYAFLRYLNDCMARIKRMTTEQGIVVALRIGYHMMSKARAGDVTAVQSLTGIMSAQGELVDKIATVKQLVTNLPTTDANIASMVELTSSDPQVARDKYTLTISEAAASEAVATVYDDGPDPADIAVGAYIYGTRIPDGTKVTDVTVDGETVTLTFDQASHVGADELPYEDTYVVGDLPEVLNLGVKLDSVISRDMPGASTSINVMDAVTVAASKAKGRLLNTTALFTTPPSSNKLNIASLISRTFA